ncbi:MAG: YihY/virulence factor BrkB family protein [Pseudoflavonifractor sp.]|nr:YihY/virulence factor BrkB family protein [Alloprevotella sp.]MCM1117169.1 YihY/virulence factor BrkB family protein [Pseudoflavonifractor sp.]
MSNQTETTPSGSKTGIGGFISRAVDKSTRIWAYVSSGVWRDTRRDWRVNVIKTLNITVRSFVNADLQNQACALTYRTVLAIVPALALVFAICRGFGFQNLLQNQLYSLVPSQRQALQMAMQFVDSYLAQASEGIFVGVGILFLLWTLISLLGSVEDSFNSIWKVRSGRTLWRKVTDYLAIFFILPILMICAGGITIVMSTALKKLVFFDFLGPVVNVVVDLLGLVLTWLFFAGAYMLIPNAKVKFVNALLSGAVVGTSFQVIQWLFITGQLYVTKYNAIYGSFSFLPLMLIWLQLSWLVTLIGALVCYASQNIGQYSFYESVDGISISYRRKVTLAVMTLIVRRFARGESPLTMRKLSQQYGLPERLVKEIALRLKDVGLVAFAEAEGESDLHPLLPAMDISSITVTETLKLLDQYGESDFIPGFDRRYGSVEVITQRVAEAVDHVAGATLLSSLDIDIDPETTT